MTLPMLRLRQDDGAGEPDTEVVPAAPVPAAVPPVPAGDAPARPEGERMSAPDQFLAVARHAFRVARRRGEDLAEREGGWVNAGLNGKPSSVNDQRDYLGQRKWLPPGHEGGIADRAGEAYHVAYGVPGVAAGNFISWLLARPFRSAWAAGAFLLVTFAGCELVGLPAALSGSVTGVLAILLMLPVALVMGALALRRGFATRRAGR